LRRVIFAIVTTASALVFLLSFKTHSTPAAVHPALGQRQSRLGRRGQPGLQRFLIHLRWQCGQDRDR
jgi:hypothetical protein